MKTIYCVFAGLLLISCNPGYNEQDPNPPQKQPVEVVRLEATEAPIPIVTSGVLGAKTELTRSFKVGGIVAALYAEEGQRVKKGQVLARLNQSEISAQVQQAQLAADKAARDLQRAENLYRDSVITLEQLQDLRTSKDATAASLRIARFNETHATIVAEESGRVLRRFAEAGELVQAGTPIFQLAYTHKDAYVIRVGVADRDVVKLSYQDSAHVTFDAYPTKKFRASVTEIAESANPQTFTFEIELTLEASELPLKNGFIGRVTIYPGDQPAYYKVSMNSLVEGEKEGAKIFVVDLETQRVSPKVVTPQIIGDGFFTVNAESFGPPAWVVTEGATYLHADQEVSLNQP